MARSLAIVVLGMLAACTSAPPPPPPQAPIAHAAPPARTCTDAAVGLDRATKGVRPPETSVAAAMRDRCNDDHWTAAAIECFATLREGDLGRCARVLDDRARDAMFGVLDGGGSAQTKLAIARARLEGLAAVGIAECDQFVLAVHTALSCEAMPIESRVDLGQQTAEFWELPTHGLPPDAQRRMAAACGASLQSLQQQAMGVGCML